MPEKPIVIVGLDPSEHAELRERISGPMLVHAMLPAWKVERGRFYVEHPRRFGQFVEVRAVVFHGIYETDLPFITGLALWGGPCLPNALGMLACRERVPSLARVRAASRFMKRPLGFAPEGVTIEADVPSVAKWGVWHCGDDKARFDQTWDATQPTLIEPYVAGRGVRIHLMGKRAWQIEMSTHSHAAGDWREASDAEGARISEDCMPDLLEDARQIQRHLGLDMAGIDYQVPEQGEPHLMEVNHIPNVTHFAELRSAYLDYVVQWVEALPTD